MSESPQASQQGGSEADSPAVSSALEGGKYVYCIICSDRDRDFGSIGIGGGQRVYTVGFNNLAAVVSDTPIVITIRPGKTSSRTSSSTSAGKLSLSCQCCTT